MFCLFIGLFVSALTYLLNCFCLFTYLFTCQPDYLFVWILGYIIDVIVLVGLLTYLCNSLLAYLFVCFTNIRLFILTNSARFFSLTENQYTVFLSKQLTQHETSETKALLSPLAHFTLYTWLLYEHAVSHLVTVSMFPLEQLCCLWGFF